MESTLWNTSLCKLILKDHTDVERLPGSACFRVADRGRAGGGPRSPPVAFPLSPAEAAEDHTSESGSPCHAPRFGRTDDLPTGLGNGLLVRPRGWDAIGAHPSCAEVQRRGQDPRETLPQMPRLGFTFIVLKGTFRLLSG